jgi:mono/diheme cytochrome c family protein
VSRGVRAALATLAAAFGLTCGRAAPVVEPARDAARIAQGRALYDRMCFACHTLDPPPTLAPPMRGISTHWRQRFATRDEAIAHFLAYARAPVAERSALPAHAVQMFGLMPPLDLAEADLRAAAEWIWSLYDPSLVPLHPTAP